MSVSRVYCRAVARAISELDQCSLRGPETGQDKTIGTRPADCSSQLWTATDSS